MVFEPLHFTSQDQALLHLLPSSRLPSDHAPVVADLRLRVEMQSGDDLRSPPGSQQGRSAQNADLLEKTGHVDGPANSLPGRSQSSARRPTGPGAKLLFSLTCRMRLAFSRTRTKRQ